MPTSPALLGTGMVQRALPKLFTSAVTSSTLTQAEQPGMPTMPRSTGSGSPAQVALDRPKMPNGALKISGGSDCSCTIQLLPIHGSEPANEPIAGVATLPGQPLPNGVMVAG